MKKVCAILCGGVLVAACNLSAATLINYQGSVMVDPAISDSVRVAFDYQDGLNEGRINFSESLILSNADYGPANIFGALRYTEFLTDLQYLTFNNDRNSTYGSRFAAYVGNADATAPGIFQAVMVWPTTGYMEAGDGISFNLAEDGATWDGSAVTDGIRYIIKNDGVYYYSETQLQGTQWAGIARGSHELPDVTTERWAIWDPTAQVDNFSAGFVLPGGGTFETRTFNSVEGVGLSFDLAKGQYGMNVEFDAFQAEGTLTVPEPSTLGSLVLGMALLLRTWVKTQM